MLTIGIICLFAFVTCNEYDDYIPQDDYDSLSGSGSGDDNVIVTTTPVPSKNVDDKGGGDNGWAIFGYILGGLGAFTGLAVIGRRLCKKSRHEKEKEKDDKDLDYNYYGVSSYA